ncbi:hypothetical protein BDC45DRAFT_541001 [Circinella umbellata]|nr:hypothetical protein BDC45DRAFT_541001 [Circinella umbellata]
MEIGCQFVENWSRRPGTNRRTIRQEVSSLRNRTQCRVMYYRTQITTDDTFKLTMKLAMRFLLFQTIIFFHFFFYHVPYIAFLIMIRPRFIRKKTVLWSYMIAFS